VKSGLKRSPPSKSKKPSGKKLRLVFTGTQENMETVRLFCKDGNYKRVSTSSCVRIETDRYCLVWSANVIGPGLLSIISMVKAHVKKQVKDGNVRHVVDKPLFCDLSGTNYDTKPFVEIDISAAYATAARNIGALSEKMYQMLMKISKRSRLIAVGCLGTKRIVTEYEEWKQTSSGVEFDADTLAVWNSIVAEVDREMRQLRRMAGPDFLMYWTDAMFVLPSAKDRIMSIIPSTGYAAKHKTSGELRKYKEYVLASDGRRFCL